MLKIYDDSKNYTAQVIKLPVKQQVKGLDNLVSVNVQGNDCLIDKNYDENELYLFFPAECQINHDFLSFNNLYRHAELNHDKTKTGFFDDNRRCKAVKFKGVISTGFVIPIKSLFEVIGSRWIELQIGDEFNEITGVEICRKYLRKVNTVGTRNKESKILDQIVDSKFVPEHFDTNHLLKYVDRLNLDDYIAVTYKLHGTSARYFNTLTKRRLPIKDKIAKFFGVKIQEEEYKFVSASRRVVKSLDFEELDNKKHYYSEDLWSKVGKEYLEGKLNHGESVYCEIIGRDYTGAEIQKGYTYGFNKPKVYIYRITNINQQGIEVDLSYQQMKHRANQLGIDTCPEYFYGTLENFICLHDHTAQQGDINNRDIEKYLNNIFFGQNYEGNFLNGLLEKPSILDNSVTEEGFVVRIDKGFKPEIYKIKSKKFLLHESGLKDKEVVDIEEEQV